MTSIADRLRRRTHEAVALLTPEERIEVALRLGDDDVRLFAERQRLTPEEARLRLRRQRQLGRARCSFLDRSE